MSVEEMTMSFVMANTILQYVWFSFWLRDRK